LGFTPTPLEQGLNTAANFIPGVGPIVSQAAQLIESLFSGSDPTPTYVLQEKMLDLRNSVALAHHQLGIPDNFALEGPIGSGQNSDALTRAVVTEGNGGHPVASADWRKGLYTAIQTFAGELATLGPQAHDSALLSQFAAMIPPSATSGSPIMQVTPSSAAPTTPAPWGTPSTMPAPGSAPPAGASAPPTSSSSAAPAGTPPALASMGGPLILGALVIGAILLASSSSPSNGSHK
jgi:hypothetical protein